ncbi:MAG: hypothetical protein Q8Q24_02145 [bacterium]|nr:hypothetical protein [bacterium]
MKKLSLPNNIAQTLNQIYKSLSPLSVFVYGSRAIGDFVKESDWEVGVVFNESNYTSRSSLSKLHSVKDLSLFPFKYEELVAGTIDTPWPKNIYLRELVSSAKTLFGDEIIENLPPPKITVFDLLQAIRFELGIAIAAAPISYRNGDIKGAGKSFYWSCLYGTRCLEILDLNIFPIGFKKIYDLSKKLSLGEYVDLPIKAFNVRNGVCLDEEVLYRNISYLNKLIEEKLLAVYKKEGNLILIK